MTASPSSLLSVDDVRASVETDLSDTTLNTFIADADSVMVGSFGPHGGATVTEDFTQEASVDTIWLGYPAAAITTIVEEAPGVMGETIQTLTPSDFILGDGGRSVRRLSIGQTGTLLLGWAPIVHITYTTANRDATRTRILLDMVQIACDRFTGQLDALAFRRQRSALLRELNPPGIGPWA